MTSLLNLAIDPVLQKDIAIVPPGHRPCTIK
jgi:hypothetical protein